MVYSSPLPERVPPCVLWTDRVPLPQCNPPELDLCEDLSRLQSVNECGVLHTLASRAEANMPLTHAGPNLVSFWPPLQARSKVLLTEQASCQRQRWYLFFLFPVRLRGPGAGSRCGTLHLLWLLWSNVCTCPWWAPGGTTACARWAAAGPVRPPPAKPSRTACSNRPVPPGGTSAVSAAAAGATRRGHRPLSVCVCPPAVERVQAMFTILRSFGCVSSQHSDASSRFAMVFSLDFNHAGQAAAGHLQVSVKHRAAAPSLSAPHPSPLSRFSIRP